MKRSAKMVKIKTTALQRPRNSIRISSGNVSVGEYNNFLLSYMANASFCRRKQTPNNKSNLIKEELSLEEAPTEYYSRDSGQRLCVHIKLNFYVTVLHFITPLIATIFQNYAIAHVRFLCLQFNYSNFIRKTTQFSLCLEYGVYVPIFLYLQ